MHGQIIQDDCHKVMAQLPDQFVQVIVTSCPYNIGKSYEKKASLDDYIESYDDKITQFHRILKDSGSIFWQTGNYVHRGEIVPLDILFYDRFKKYGFKLRNRIIWHFEHGLHCSRRLSGRYETILFFTKSDDYIFNLDNIRIPSKYPNKKYFKGPKKGQLSGNPKGKNPSDVWKILAQDWENEIWHIPNVKHNHPEKTSHPCQFPVELVERCILVASDEGDLIFDPYCGVGSTVIAAIKNKRQGIGTEIDSEYCKIAEERLKLFHEGKLKFRPIERVIYKDKK